MIKKLRDLFFKPPKKSPEKEDEIQVLSYINVAIDKDDQVIIDGDFGEDGDDAIAKLIFLMCSGSLSEWLIDIVHDRCDGDSERADNILCNAHKMIVKYIHNHKNPCIGEEEDDDEDPVVDPCEVFKPKTGEEDEDE